ncbi:hypothetical protein JYU34_017815 [Plutella xylostella]|uniref:Uncharacterized protein n=1 Tax=Plutella xylostella TaxID=51655 RepID=A0ABQ7Q5R9_PLUXY|nr:hypothetical protein JYU34_017815 [Plutella xylostella]
MKLSIFFVLALCACASLAAPQLQWDPSGQYRVLAHAPLAYLPPLAYPPLAYPPLAYPAVALQRARAPFFYDYKQL